MDNGVLAPARKVDVTKLALEILAVVFTLHSVLFDDAMSYLFLLSLIHSTAWALLVDCISLRA